MFALNRKFFMADSDYSPLGKERISRIVEMKIPLPAVISSVVAVAFTLVSMYFSVQRLTEDVGELKMTVKASISQSQTSDARLNVLQWRVESLEQNSGKVVQRK